MVPLVSSLSTFTPSRPSLLSQPICSPQRRRTVVALSGVGSHKLGGRRFSRHTSQSKRKYDPVFLVPHSTSLHRPRSDRRGRLYLCIFWPSGAHPQRLFDYEGSCRQSPNLYVAYLTPARAGCDKQWHVSIPLLCHRFYDR